MRIQGPPSWRIVIDEPENLHLVLFVRDYCGLPAGAEGAPGPLTPAVPAVPGLLEEPARRAAGAAWPAWWQAAAGGHQAASGPPPRGALAGAQRQRVLRAFEFADGPDFGSLSGFPGLRQAAIAAFAPFRQWWSPPLPPRPASQPASTGAPGLPGARGYLIDLHLRRRTIHDVVTQIERELGRSARPFELRIDILAVTRPAVISQDEQHAVISAQLLTSENAYRDWLCQAIRPIA